MVPITPYRYLLRTSGSIMATLNMHSIESRMITIDSFLHFKAKHAHNAKENRYIDNDIFFVVCSILSTSIEGNAYYDYIRKYYNYYRSLAWQRFKANLASLRIKRVIKALCICIHPLLYRELFK